MGRDGRRFCGAGGVATAGAALDGLGEAWDSEPGAPGIQTMWVFRPHQ